MTHRRTSEVILIDNSFSVKAPLQSDYRKDDFLSKIDQQSIPSLLYNSQTIRNLNIDEEDNIICSTEKLHSPYGYSVATEYMSPNKESLGQYLESTKLTASTASTASIKSTHSIKSGISTPYHLSQYLNKYDYHNINQENMSSSFKETNLISLKQNDLISQKEDNLISQKEDNLILQKEDNLISQKENNPPSLDINAISLTKRDYNDISSIKRDCNDIRPISCDTNIPVSMNTQIKKVLNINSRKYKSIRKQDMFSASVWIPYIIHRYDSSLSKCNKYMLLFNIYSWCMFLIIASLILSNMIAYKTIARYKYEHIWDFNLERMICFVISSTILVMTIISEIKSSLMPLLFWWNIIKYGEWDFECYEKDNETEITSISSPKWNTIIRFSILLTSQFLTYIILMLSGLVYLYTITDIIEIIVNSLMFVFILQFDEYIFSFILSTNQYFKKLWQDEAHEDTVYVFYKRNIQCHKYYKLNMYATLPCTLILVTLCITFIIVEILNIFYQPETTITLSNISYTMTS